MKFIKQLNENDCGTACLGMIFKNKYNIDIDMSEIRELTKTDNRGVSLYGLITCSEKYGIDSEVLNGSIDNLIDSAQNQEITTPFIAHVMNGDMFHFVVVSNINSKSITIYDPSYGKVILSIYEFEKIWVGNILVFSDTINDKSILVKKKNIQKLSIRTLLNINKKKLISVLFLSAVISFISIIFSMSYQYVIDNYILKKAYDINSFKILIFSVVLIIIIQFILSILRSFLLANFSKELSDNLYKLFYSKVIELKESFFYNNSIGDILTREQSIIEIQSLFSGTIITMVLEIFSLGFATIFLLNINLQLFLIVLLLSIIYLCITLLFIKPIKKLNINKIDQNGKKISIVNESLSGLSTIQVYNYDSFFTKKYRQRTNDLTVTYRKEVIIVNSMNSIVFFIESIFMLIILLYGATLVKNNHLTLGQLIAFTSITSAFVIPIKNLVASQESIQRLITILNKINDILFTNNTSTKIKEGTTIDKNILEFDDVDFSYSFDNTLFNNLNLEIEKGTKVGITGESGVGKTTLIKIMAGLISVDSGNILASHNYLKNIAYVPQDSFIFNGTIKDNICLSKKDNRLLEQIVTSLQLDHKFDSLELGLDTVLYENGTNISGGQKQLIGLARAFFKNSDILILDEATSNLDELSEKLVINYMNEFLNNKTIIFNYHNTKLKNIFDKHILLIKEKGKVNVVIE